MSLPPAAPSAARHPAPLRTRIAVPWAALSVGLLAVVPMLVSLRAAFLYDDTTIIRDNGWLRGWPALIRVWGEPYWPTAGPDALGLYRPLHIALLSAIWNVGGGSPLPFHVYALALSACTAIAVWWLARRATGPAAALLAALWFASHPLHVEAVGSVANSSELLVVLGIVALARLFIGDDDEGATEPSWAHALAIGAIAGGTLLSKESGLCALPLALVTAWGWRRPAPDRHWRETLRRNRRGIGAGIAAIALALLARRIVLGAAVSRVSIAASGVERSAADRVATMLSLWPRIAGSILWPTSLAPYYGPTIIPTHRASLALASVLVAVAALALAARLARRGDRRPLVALAWIGLTYLPASNLLVATGQLLSDRNLFGATAGAALALAWALDRVPPPARRVAMGLVVVLVVHASLASARYAVTWTSHRALWRHLVEVEPAEHLGYKLLGMDARARGNHDEAIALLGRARLMDPADRQIRFEYGEALYEAGRFGAAANVLEGLLRDEDVRDETGFVRLYLDAVGRARGAQAVVDAARPLLSSRSGAVAALYTGMALDRLGRRSAADSAWRAGLLASPGDSALTARLQSR